MSKIFIRLPSWHCLMENGVIWKVDEIFFKRILEIKYFSKSNLKCINADNFVCGVCAWIWLTWISLCCFHSVLCFLIQLRANIAYRDCYTNIALFSIFTSKNEITSFSFKILKSWLQISMTSKYIFLLGAFLTGILPNYLGAR